MNRESCKNVELGNCGIVELGKTPRERMLSWGVVELLSWEGPGEGIDSLVV